MRKETGELRKLQTEAESAGQLAQDLLAPVQAGAKARVVDQHFIERFQPSAGAARAGALPRSVPARAIEPLAAGGGAEPP